MMFVVPVFTAKCQRLGDLVAGTIVVADHKTDLGSLRTDLTSQKITDSKFQFDVAVRIVPDHKILPLSKSCSNVGHRCQKATGKILSIVSSSRSPPACKSNVHRRTIAITSLAIYSPPNTPPTPQARIIWLSKRVL